MSWRLLGRFVLTKNWQYTTPTNYQIFRLKNNFISNRDNQYLKGAISSVFLENQKVNLFDSRRLSWRNEQEIFVFDFPKALGSQRIGLRRLDDTKLIWSVDIEVFEVEMSNLELSINGLAITDVDGLQLALSEKASKSELTQLEQELLAAIANLQPPSVGDIPGLQDALNSKASTTQLTEAIANLQTQTEDELETGFANLVGLLPKTSIEEPTNPFVGLVWNEIDTNGELEESWIRQGNRWVSQTLYSLDYPSPTSSITGSVSYGFPLNNSYDYLFKEFSYFCQYSSGTVDATNFWRCLFTTQPTGQTFADSGAIANTNAASQVVPLNVLFSPAVGERLLLMINKVGAAPGARVGAGLKFRRVRK